MVRSSGVQSFQCSQWSQQHQPSITRMPCSIGEMKELIGFELAFEANGVQVHVAHQAELVAQAVLIGAQQHVLRPAAAANQNALAVHAEETAAVGREFRGDFADAEVHALLVGHLACDAEAHGEALQMRLAHLVRPPELGIVNAQLRELLGREDDCRGLRAAPARPAVQSATPAAVPAATPFTA